MALVASMALLAPMFFVALVAPVFSMSLVVFMVSVSGSLCVKCRWFEVERRERSSWYNDFQYSYTT